MLRSLFIAVILLRQRLPRNAESAPAHCHQSLAWLRIPYLAERLKLFEAEGVEVRILQFSSLE